MATYVMSDIHGMYDMFLDILGQIDLKDDDTLYILGDILDRGPHPIKTLLKIMEMPNVICVVGNHEFMALKCLEFLRQEITLESINDLDDVFLENFMTWMQNGGGKTMDEFYPLDKDTQDDIIEFIKDCEVFVRLTVGGKKYILVHAGLGNFSPDKRLEEYSLYEFIWERPDYNVKYFDDIYVVTGHTPTCLLEDEPSAGRIIRKNNHIAIDCGSFIPGGSLAALCLDSGEEFYAKREKSAEHD